jgi:hypothetical protein
VRKDERGEALEKGETVEKGVKLLIENILY